MMNAKGKADLLNRTHDRVFLLHAETMASSFFKLAWRKERFKSWGLS